MYVRLIKWASVWLIDRDHLEGVIIMKHGLVPTGDASALEVVPHLPGDDAWIWQEALLPPTFRANATRSHNDGLLLGKRLRQWPNIERRWTSAWEALFISTMGASERWWSLPAATLTVPGRHKCRYLCRSGLVRALSLQKTTPWRVWVDKSGNN